MDLDMTNLTMGSLALIGAAGSWIFAIRSRKVMSKRGLDSRAHAVRAAQAAAQTIKLHERIVALRAPCANCGAAPPPLPPPNP